MTLTWTSLWDVVSVFISSLAGPRARTSQRWGPQTAGPRWKDLLPVCVMGDRGGRTSPSVGLQPYADVC